MIEFEVEYDEHMMSDLMSQVHDMPWDELGDWGTEVVHQNFDEGGRPGKWPDKKDGSQSFLQDTGALKDSVDATRRHDGVEVGYGLDYGQFHRTGTVNMPQRDFGSNMESADDERGLDGVLKDWLERIDT